VTFTTASDGDPIFAAIAAHRKANLDRAAELKRDGSDHPDCEAASARESVAYEIFWRTMPTTFAGMCAYFQYLQEPRWPVDQDVEPNPDRPFTIIEYVVTEHGPDDITEWAWSRRYGASRPSDRGAVMRPGPKPGAHSRLHPSEGSSSHAFSARSPSLRKSRARAAMSPTGWFGGGTHACSHPDFDLGSRWRRGGGGLGIGCSQARGGICRQEPPAPYRSMSSS
jgi:hypothetical protein